MRLKPDCRHFPGDRPCDIHKRTGVHCDTCTEYSPRGQRILVIKFDALGDVLRTTCLLPSLKKKYPQSYIVWLTRSNAVSLFENNPLVDDVWRAEDPTTLSRLDVMEFDLMIHPDASPASAAFAQRATARERLGFGLNPDGSIRCYNAEAEPWLEMGAFDDLKKANRKTYQQIIHDIARLSYERSEIMVILSEPEKRMTAGFRSRHKLERFPLLVGLNTGAGGRWQFKKWTLDGYRELIRRLISDLKCGVLLYGGPEEVERNHELAAISPDVIDTGTNNNVREFFALVDLCDILVTGDTMALHVATALKKQVVCLFGPTSANEIDDYGRIQKIQPDLDCLVCYKMECDFVPNCMESIRVDMVMDAIRRAEASL